MKGSYSDKTQSLIDQTAAQKFKDGYAAQNQWHFNKEFPQYVINQLWQSIYYMDGSIISLTKPWRFD